MTTEYLQSDRLASTNNMKFFSNLLLMMLRLRADGIFDWVAFTSSFPFIGAVLITELGSASRALTHFEGKALCNMYHRETECNYNL